MSFPGSGSVYSVTIKPSTRSARSIAVTSVLKLWRHGGRREPPKRTSNLGCGHGRARMERPKKVGARSHAVGLLANQGPPLRKISSLDFAIRSSVFILWIILNEINYRPKQHEKVTTFLLTRRLQND